MLAYLLALSSQEGNEKKKVAGKEDEEENVNSSTQISNSALALSMTLF